MYDLQIVESTDQDCQELTVDGFAVLVPNASSHLLDGIEIDYVDRLIGGGFKINNPNANLVLAAAVNHSLESDLMSD